MSFTEISSNNGFLSYGITTSPDPIQASPMKGDPSIASIIVTVSNSTVKPIYCNKITFSFLIGPNAQDLTADPSGILIASNASDKWQIKMTSAGVFTATPIAPNDNKITADGLSFQIYNITTNNQVGTFEFKVEENSSLDNTNFTNKNNTYELTKFPYGFYVNNFAASKPMVNDGNSVTLTWIGSDLAAYHIFYGTNSVDVTNTRSWTSPGLTNTTTFALKATVQYQGETVDNYLYVTVVVANAEITATSLKVLQTTNLIGAASLGETLDVKGDTTLLNATVSGSLNVSGNSNLDGTLNVSGETTLGQANIGAINSPTAYITNLSADSISTSKSFNATQSVISMITGAQSIGTGTFTANSDGMVVGQVMGPSNVNSVSFASVYGSTSAGISLYAYGGNFLGYSGWNNYQWNLNENFTMPVAKGNTWSVGLYNWEKNDNNGTGTFWWIPFGNSAGTSFEQISDEMPAYKGRHPVFQELSEFQANTRTQIHDFIHSLSKAFQAELTEEMEVELNALMGNLFIKAEKSQPI